MEHNLSNVGTIVDVNENKETSTFSSFNEQNDINASILAQYMIVLFTMILIMWGIILYNSYRSGGNLTYIIFTMLFVIVIFGAWAIYYQNTGKPFVLYDRDNINMPLQHISFLLMIVFILFYALYIGYTGYNYEIQ